MAHGASAGGAREHQGAGEYGPYIRLGGMTLLAFLFMYAFMYTMVDRFSNVFPNLNQAYMAGLMAAPMVPIELAVMRSMYPNMRLNVALVALSAGVLLLFWVLIRQQSGIQDEQFLKSMIPHHAGAILMCEEAKLRDPELERLCQSIVSSQQEEIDLMKSKLAEHRADG